MPPRAHAFRRHAPAADAPAVAPSRTLTSPPAEFCSLASCDGAYDETSMHKAGKEAKGERKILG